MATTEPASYTPNIPTTPQTYSTPNIYISLTPLPLAPLIPTLTSFVRSPSIGATVLFIGSTRDSFDNLPVSSLAYTSYPPLALRTLRSIGSAILSKYPQAEKIAIVHKLGECPVGEESIVIAVSAKHRGEAWRAGEEALEETKRRAEIWKLERFERGEGVWRANRDGGKGVKVDEEEEQKQEQKQAQEQGQEQEGKLGVKAGEAASETPSSGVTEAYGRAETAKQEELVAKGADVSR